MARTLLVDPRHPSGTHVEEAARTIRGGGLVGFPTETFYGLGANALDPVAVGRVFRAKGRPDDKPLLVLVASVAMVEQVAAEISPHARRLMARDWPGPLTLVLRARTGLPDLLTAGTRTVGVRNLEPPGGAGPRGGGGLARHGAERESSRRVPPADGDGGGGGSE